MKTRFLLSILAGLLIPLGYPPFYLWWLSLLAFLPFLVSLSHSRDDGEASLLGLSCGLVAVGITHFWITSFIRWAGSWAVIFYLLVLVYQSSFFVLFGRLFSRLKKRYSGGVALLCAPLLWTLLEHAASYGTFGLQEILGHSQFLNPFLKGGASLLGVNYVTFLAVGLNAALVLVLSPPRKRFLRKVLVVIFLGMLILATNLLHVRQAEQLPREAQLPLSIALIQPPLDPAGINQPTGEGYVFSAYLDETRRTLSHPAQLVIWPEMTFPTPPPQKGRYWYQLVPLLEGSGRWFLIGAHEHRGGKNYNAAFLLSRAEIVGHYEKERLFPYGEAIPRPSLLRWVRGLLPPKLRHDAISPGVAIAPLASPYGALGVTICLESLYADLVRRRAREGAVVLVNLTNDAWFAESSAAERHFFIGAMRAIENGRYFVQSALYGVTGIVDPEGKIVERTGPSGNRTLEATVFPYEGKTLFTRIGLWRFFIFFFLTVIPILLGKILWTN